MKSKTCVRAILCVVALILVNASRSRAAAPDADADDSDLPASSSDGRRDDVDRAIDRAVHSC